VSAVTIKGAGQFERQEGNGMRTAFVQLLSDFLSAIVFLAIYGSTENVYLATGMAIAVSLAQLAVAKVRGRPVDAMQWLVLGMVVVLGSATLITEDSRFIMVKPSIVHFAVGAVMLRRGWMMRYLPPIARDNIPESVLVGSGYAWATLMFALGALNIIIVVTLPFAVWAWFISVGAIGTKICGFPPTIRGFPHHRSQEVASGRCLRSALLLGFASCCGQKPCTGIHVYVSEDALAFFAIDWHKRGRRLGDHHRQSSRSAPKI
jgi:intracellular septation protein